MEGDPFGVYNKDCQISGSQEDILAHSHFARQDDFPSPFNSGIDWPELSSSSSAASSPSAVFAITICSAPETPETHHADGGATTPQPEEYKTPPEVAAPTSASSEEVVSVGRNPGVGETSPVGGDSPDLGFSGEEENPNRKREREESYEISLSRKKLKDSDELGFQESTCEVQGTVVLVSDDDDEVEVEEERENGEETRNGKDNEAKNDVDERKEGTEMEKFEVRAEMNEKGTLKVQLNLETNSNSKENGLNLMKCLIDALRNLAGGNQEGEKDEPEDIFETGKQRGMTFPRSRWYD